MKRVTIMLTDSEYDALSVRAKSQFRTISGQVCAELHQTASAVDSTHQIAATVAHIKGADRVVSLPAPQTASACAELHQTASAVVSIPLGSGTRTKEEEQAIIAKWSRKTPAV